MTLPVAIIDTFDCPACKAKVQVGHTENGDMLFHAMPPCESYVKLNESDYKALVRRHRA